MKTKRRKPIRAFCPKEEAIRVFQMEDPDEIGCVTCGKRVYSSEALPYVEAHELH